MKSIMSSLLGATKSMSKSSGSMLKSASLSMTIANEEENLRSLHMEMGAKVCEMYAEGRQISPFFDERYDYVREIEYKLANLRDQLTKIRGARSCTSCGTHVDKSAEFCPACGVRIENME